MRACAVMLTASASALASQAAVDVAPPHGYVEPCTVSFVADNTVECEECSPSHDNPRRCDEKLGSLGYERKCRTIGHSAPSEVWCIAKRDKKTSLAPYALALVALSGLLGVFLFLRRRRGSAE